MNKSISLKIISLLILVFCILERGRGQLQIIYDDDMESYTTATTSSIGTVPASSNPVDWRFQAYQGRVTPASFTHNPASIVGSTTAGMATEPGNRYARLQTTFSSVPNTQDYWGTQLWMAPSTAPVTDATGYASYSYSIRVRVNVAMGFYIQFNSLDSMGNLNGTYRKWFSVTTPGVWVTLYGNLAEPGWAANPFAAGGTPMVINNSTGHQVFFELNELNGNPKSTNLQFHVDDMMFWVPEPPYVTIALLGALLSISLGSRLLTKRFATQEAKSSTLL